ncbi:methyltransferase-like protein 17, mitochondrial [Panonychus citri]|uniref:methyltransferase-like protein 17, mitochondrial n=1 Tax=Panonychus citri TaxID=50023 RepID=UPI00230723CF|nr:methyltransferase-like protein 17, mitochondrial [Panonychus citri]
MFSSRIVRIKLPSNLIVSNSSDSIRSLTKLVTKYELHEDVNEKLNQGLRHREHPGRRSLPCVSLPYILESAAQKVISKYKRKTFRDDVRRMYNQFHHRQLPAEAAEIHEKYKEIEYRFVEKEKFIVDDLDPIAKEEALRKRQEKIQSALKREIYNWQRFDYDEYNSVVYMTARLPPNYAAIKHVFNEIKCDYPEFKPRTLFDFGSGVGTTIWAANEIWPNSFSEYFCVDISHHAHDIARLLLKQGNENSPLVYEGVFTRQFLPVSHNIKYDIVVSAYSLLELPSLASRVQTIENLWHKTEDLLVIIEHGKKSGFMAVLEARNLVLQMTGHKVTDTFNVDDSVNQVIQSNEFPASSIMAPCPHNYPCPKLFTGQISPCNFSISYEHLDISDFRKILWGTREEFSYCVIQKKPISLGDNPPWPRVISPVIKKQKRATCKLCCPDGTMKTISVNKNRQPKNLYNLVRLSKWSDKLPVTISQELKEMTIPESKSTDNQDDGNNLEEVEEDETNPDEINSSQQSTNQQQQGSQASKNLDEIKSKETKH